MIFIVWWLLGLAIGCTTTIFNKSLNTINLVAENLLFYQLTITITLTGLTCFAGHVFKSDVIAQKNGWPKGNLFQKELGVSELGWAFGGILAIWFKGTWLSTIVIFSTMLIGAAIIHIYDTRKNKNYKKGNPIMVIADLAIPISIIALSVLSGIWINQ